MRALHVRAAGCALPAGLSMAGQGARRPATYGFASITWCKASMLWTLRQGAWTCVHTCTRRAHVKFVVLKGNTAHCSWQTETLWPSVQCRIICNGTMNKHAVIGKQLHEHYRWPAELSPAAISVPVSHTLAHYPSVTHIQTHKVGKVTYRLLTVSSLTVIIAKLSGVSLTVTSGWRLSLRLNPTWFDWIPSFLDFLVVFFIISSI